MRTRLETPWPRWAPAPARYGVPAREIRPSAATSTSPAAAGYVPGGSPPWVTASLMRTVRSTPLHRRMHLRTEAGR